uniref:Uncharacterized protein n=1 Tax=Tanacetum cinerariifolium TaxID=118510 RepID=A0A6L2K778_TANCI|nr:hypothetical protein [Tanacetum cinerariifolium]
MANLKKLAIDSKSKLLSEQILLCVEREMERELRMTRVLTDLCHEVTEAAKDKVNLIEEVKQHGGRASALNSMAYLRILRGQDMDKTKDITKLIKDTQAHNREMYTFIANTLGGSGGESIWEEGDNFRVDVLRFHTYLIDILSFLEKLEWWFEQDIDDEEGWMKRMKMIERIE